MASRKGTFFAKTIWTGNLELHVLRTSLLAATTFHKICFLQRLELYERFIIYFWWPRTCTHIKSTLPERYTRFTYTLVQGSTMIALASLLLLIDHSTYLGVVFYWCITQYPRSFLSSRQEDSPICRKIRGNPLEELTYSINGFKTVQDGKDKFLIGKEA